MSDIALTWNGQGADLALSGADFAIDHELVTPVVVALFSDRRAGESDPLPDDANDRRGWWGDSYAEKGRLIGSRLWLLSREKQIRDVPMRAREYASEGLTELVALGRALKTEAVATVPRARMLSLAIVVQRPLLDPVELTLERAI